MFVTTIITALLLGQPLPPHISDGSCIVEYTIGETGMRSIAGVDIQSGAVLLRDNHRRLTLIRTPEGKTLQLRDGETEFVAVENSAVPSIEQFTDRFPFLVLYALDKIEADRLSVEQLRNGTTVVQVRLTLGNLGLTAVGYTPPGGPNDSVVSYTFDSNGKLTTIARDGSPDTSLIYAEAEHTPLAPADPSKYVQEGMIVADVETYVPGRPNLFREEALLQRIVELNTTTAAAEQKFVESTLQTASGKEDHLEQQSPDAGPLGLRSKRGALIISGLIVISIGSLAWWRNRS